MIVCLQFLRFSNNTSFNGLKIIDLFYDCSQLDDVGISMICVPHVDSTFSHVGVVQNVLQSVVFLGVGSSFFFLPFSSLLICSWT